MVSVATSAATTQSDWENADTVFARARKSIHFRERSARKIYFVTREFSARPAYSSSRREAWWLNKSRGYRGNRRIEKNVTGKEQRITYKDHVCVIYPLLDYNTASLYISWKLNSICHRNLRNFFPFLPLSLSLPYFVTCFLIRKFILLIFNLRMKEYSD